MHGLALPPQNALSLLDPASSEALLARANFRLLSFTAFAATTRPSSRVGSDMQQAIDLDPANSLAFEDFGRAILWNEPELASSLLERAIQVDLLLRWAHTF